MCSSFGLAILLTSFFLSITWSHHCDDETGPYKKLTKCNANKTHFCYNLVEDLSSFSCRCAGDASCKEPCGINIFRAWSSEQGSWIKPIKRANRIPHIPISKYAKCMNNSIKIDAPHRYPYTMCMCNDHYYSYGMSMKDQQDMRNFTRVLRLKLRFEKPRMYILSPQNYVRNLPYITLPNFNYRNCTDVTEGESYTPKGFLGTSWCNQTFCEQNSPYGRDRANPRYKVMKCAETCTCFLEPDEETLKKAQVRNALVDIQRDKADHDRDLEEAQFDKEIASESTTEAYVGPTSAEVKDEYNNLNHDSAAADSKPMENSHANSNRK